MRSIVVSFATLLVIFASCKKSEQIPAPPTTTTPPPVKGSGYTKSMCGTRTFRKVVSGYNPTTTPSIYSDTTIVAVDIVYKDDATVFVDPYTYNFASADSAGNVTYKVASDPREYTASLTFNHLTNYVEIAQSHHISAGSGNRSTIYTSL